MLSLLIISFALSFIAAFFFVRGWPAHAQGYGEDKPQRFHLGDISRLGGAAMLVGLLAGWGASAMGLRLDGVHQANKAMDISQAWRWAVCILPAVLAGIGEDLTHRISVRYRLAMTALTGVLAITLLDVAVPRLGVPFVDPVLFSLPWLGVLFALFAICGLPHAFNIIDGYNGLAGTVSLMICAALAFVAFQVGDYQLIAILVCLAGATLGFLVWNYPSGVIFAGDGGAYLWGVVIALVSITLVQRHPVVSPWFPMLLLIYPVGETLFSIYRKWARGISPGEADALHFHQLIYRRIVRGVFSKDTANHILIRNNRTSPYLWGFALLSVVPAVLFWRSSLLLALACGLFIVSYVVVYLAIVRFKVQRFLAKKKRNT